MASRHDAGGEKMVSARSESVRVVVAAGGHKEEVEKGLVLIVNDLGIRG